MFFFTGRYLFINKNVVDEKKLSYLPCLLKTQSQTTKKSNYNSGDLISNMTSLNNSDFMKQNVQFYNNR